MPELRSVYFGRMTYAEEAAFEFPEGLPGFETQKHFALIQIPEQSPLVYLQSLEDARLCFAALPVRSVLRDYALELTVGERETLGEAEERELLPLALLSFVDGEAPTANLAAPVVLGMNSLRGVQAMGGASRYSFRHPVGPAAGEPCW